jgi:hypothetical protein
MRSKSLEIELSDFEAENATLTGDYLWQVAEIVIGGTPTVLEIRYMCLFIPLCRILLQGAVVVKRRSWKTASSSSSLCRTSQGNPKAICEKERF